MRLTRRRIALTVGALAAAAMLVAGGLAVRSVLRARARLAQTEAARRPRVAPEPPRLDVRQRAQARPPSAPVVAIPLAPSGSGVDPLSFARRTAAEYRQRARYPRWSQPIEGPDDPLDLEQERPTGDAVVGGPIDLHLTGNYRDATDGGDLTVDAEVDVTAGGRFHIEASLYSADGQRPIAWAQHTAELPTGRQWLRLRFYGLILRERGIDGPYLVRSIALSALTQVPIVTSPLTRDAYVTAAYAANIFTDRSFDDPDLLDAADRIEQALEGLLPEGGS